MIVAGGIAAIPRYVVPAVLINTNLGHLFGGVSIQLGNHVSKALQAEPSEQLYLGLRIVLEKIEVTFINPGLNHLGRLGVALCGVVFPRQEVFSQPAYQLLMVRHP